MRQVGEETFRICRELLDEVVLVSTDEICAACKDTFDDTRAAAEPAGAVGLAGLKKYAARRRGTGALVTINSGANLNFDRLRHIAERAELGERREALLAVTIPERKGAYLEFIRAVGPARRDRIQLPLGRPPKPPTSSWACASPAVTRSGTRWSRRCETPATTSPTCRRTRPPRCTSATWWAAASPALSDERLYRFQFPERPGALLKFLDGLAQGWNITLFHYRNHGRRLRPRARRLRG